jgi:2-hydroxychromene-2-carboxylate isomerase
MIEYFYSAHSAFAYLGSARLIEIAKSAGHEIAHKPINLRRVMIESGAGSTRDRSNRHRAYYFGREIERWAEWRNAPVVAQTPPTHHHKDMTLCNGMIIAGIEQGHNVNQLAHRMLEAHWRDDADLADRKTLVQLTKEVNLDPIPLLTPPHRRKSRQYFWKTRRRAFDVLFSGLQRISSTATCSMAKIIWNMSNTPASSVSKVSGRAINDSGSVAIQQ